MIVLYKRGDGVGVSSLDSKSVDPDWAGQMPFILSLFKLIVRSVRYLDHLFFDEKNHHEHLYMGVDPTHMVQIVTWWVTSSHRRDETKLKFLEDVSQWGSPVISLVLF